MAQTGYDRTQPGDPTHNISTQDARQGRNVKGMVWVLGLSIALVIGAYAVMLALQAEPVTVDNRAATDAAPAASAAAPAPTAETAQSPS